MRIRALTTACTAALIAALAPAAASAHPGGQDAAGGHRCYTDCARYGLTQGEYHTHHGQSGAGTRGSSAGGTSVVTREDCDNRRIRRRGRVLSREECERLIGQRVSLANTGLDARIIGVAGLACLLGAAMLRRRPRTAAG